MMRPAGPNVWVLIALLAAISVIFLSNQATGPEIVSYSFFRDQLSKGNVDYVQFEGRDGIGRFKDPPIAPKEVDSDGKLVQPEKDGKPATLEKTFRVTIPEWVGEQERNQLDELLEEKTVWMYKAPSDRSAMFVTVLSLLLPLLLFFFLWSMFRRTREQIMGGGFLSGFSKSPAKRYEIDGHADHVQRCRRTGRRQGRLAGDRRLPARPRSFQRLGGRVPKGVLLNGPAGNRQDAAGTGRGGRGRRAVLFGQRLRVHSDVRRRGGQPRPRSVPEGQGESPRRSSSSTRSMRSAGNAVRAWAADTTNANKRSIRSLARWMASRRPIR